MANVNQNKCGLKLLDDVEMVPDSAFSASSSFEHKSKVEKKMDLSPKAARESYDKDNQEFAWCPNNKVSSDLKEYLEIDMGRLTVINFAQTRGRFAQGAGKEFIPYYKLKYRREVTEDWRLYKKFDNTLGHSDILKGPSDPFLDAYETLDPPIVTRWIRIYPFSYVTMRVCMKLQLFGCKFENNLLEYRIPQGNEPKKPFITLPGMLSTIIKIFQDSSYDGSYDQGLLNSGLGRLTDNKTGGDFMAFPNEAQHFVGWNSNDITASDEKTITLWFRFDSVRNFSSVRLNGYENKTMKISHPRKLEAKFSVLGEIFSDIDTIVSSYPESKSDKFSAQSSPWTQFNLQHRIGQFLQLKLYFEMDWILLTEIDFNSEKAMMLSVDQEILVTSTQRIDVDATSVPDNPQSHIDSNTSVDAVYILTILLCLLLGIIIAISVFWLVIRRKRINRKKDIKKHELAFYSQNPFKTLSLSPHGVLHTISNSYLGKYSSGSLQIAPRPSIGSQPDSCLYKHNPNPQNCISSNKQSLQANDGSIYTSIPGSDNDSSLSTDYMINSAVNNTHSYAQAVPVTMNDFIISQPQIIGNPLADFIDNQPFLCRAPNSNLRTYEPDLFALGNGSRNSNVQSFSGSSGYQPIDYNSATLDKSYYPIPRSYQGSPMKSDRIL